MGESGTVSATYPKADTNKVSGLPLAVNRNPPALSQGITACVDFKTMPANGMGSPVFSSVTLPFTFIDWAVSVPCTESSSKKKENNFFKRDKNNHTRQTTDHFTISFSFEKKFF